MTENTNSTTNSTTSPFTSDLFDDDELKSFEEQQFTPEQITFLEGYLQKRGFDKTASGTIGKSKQEELAGSLLDSLSAPLTPAHQAESLIAKRLATAPLARNRSEYNRKVRNIRKNTYSDFGIEDPLRPKIEAPEDSPLYERRIK